MGKGIHGMKILKAGRHRSEPETNYFLRDFLRRSVLIILVGEIMMNVKEACRLRGDSPGLFHRQRGHLLIIARQKT